MIATNLLFGFICVVGYHGVSGFALSPVSSASACGSNADTGIATSTTALFEKSVSSSSSSTKEISRRNLIADIALSSSAALLSFPFVAGANGEEGFTSDPRGFSYKVITPPTSEDGPTSRGQKVTVSYTLSLNGFVIDSQISNPVGTTVESSSGLFGDKPITFPVGVGSVIKGWDYVTRDMKVGERRLVIIPSDLGYGKVSMKGAAVGGVDIPPNSTLYYDITLKDIGPVPVLTEKQRQWLEANPE